MQKNNKKISKLKLSAQIKIKNDVKFEKFLNLYKNDVNYNGIC